MFRKTYPELERSLILESRKFFPPEICKYNDQKHFWTVKTGKKESHIWFGYCEKEADVFKYQGGQWGGIFFDESTHFTKYIFDYLLSRCRSVVPGCWPRVRLATNPGNIGHNWHKDYFQIGKRPPGEVWRPDKDDGASVLPMTRAFIPATVYDNPVLMKNDPQYIARLEALPPVQKQMLLYGSWDSFSGQFFTEFKRSAHVIKPFEIPAHWLRYRCVDSGYTAPFACLWIAVSPDGHYFMYQELYQTQLRDKEQAKMIKQFSGHAVEYTIGDPAMAAKKSDSGVSAQENYLREGIAVVMGANSRVPGWMAVRNFLAKHTDGKPILQIFDKCVNFIREVEDAITDERNPEDLDTSGSDHALDAFRYFAMSRPQITKPREDKDEPTSDEATKREWRAFREKARSINARKNEPILHGFNYDGEADGQGL